MKELKLICKIIMLPSEVRSNIHKYCGKLYTGETGLDATIVDFKNLYVVSNRKIKEGDYHIAPGIIKSSGEKALAYTDKEQLKAIGSNIGNCAVRVEATTNPLLGLPLIPQSFIEAYVKGNGNIDEVIVEMNHPHDGCKMDWDNKTFELIVKMRGDNTIIIHKAKLYSRDEVIELLANARLADVVGGPEFSLEKWIEENL